jgi:predicted ATPase
MIKRVKIRDFKSIRSLDLVLDPVTVLIGRCGTGKSNIVQSLRFLRNLLLEGMEAAVRHEQGWERIVPAGEHQPATSIEVVFSLPGEDKELTYSISFGYLQQHTFQRQMILRSECLLLGTDVLFSRSRNLASNRSVAWEWEKLPYLSTPPNHIDAPMLGCFPSLEKIVHAYAGLSSGIGCYHFPASTLVMTQNGHGNHGSPVSSNMPGLSDDAQNFLGVMRGITQDFHHPNLRKSLLASVRALNPSIASIELDSLNNPQRAVVGHTAAGRVFELDLQQESDGFRRFYAHLLALYQNPSKLALIFEEPENAIYPGALSLLADEFKAAPGEHRGQVIITTHSPAFLDSFDVENVRVVEMKDGQTKAGPVSKEQAAAIKEHLLTTGELLMVDHARMDEPEMAGQPA